MSKQFLSGIQRIFSRRRSEPKSTPPPIRPARPENLLPPDSVIARYTKGPITYYIYNDERGLPRLRFIEPPPIDEDRLRLLVAGIEEPRDRVEAYYVEKAKSGYGSLYPLIIDENIEEIAVDGPGRRVSVINTMIPGKWIDVDLVLDERELDGLAIQLARKAGRLLSLASPYAEGLTVDGHRIAVTLGREVTRFGSTVVVRKYPEKPISIGYLLATRVLSPLAAAYLWLLIEARGFLLIIGGMGAGKTTLLQSLANLIPPHHRVITIEDTPEIRLYHPHWDSLVTRPRPPGEEIEEVTLEDLLKFALRRRADHVIVGEVRGREARLLAQAAASGHGSLATFHADTPESAILRLSLEPINLPRLFLNLITAFVTIRRIPVAGSGVIRRVYSITEVVDDELVTVFQWRPDMDRLEPVTAEEVVERSRRLREAWELLGMIGESLEVELEERARFLEERANVPPETFAASLAKYYARRYG